MIETVTRTLMAEYSAKLQVATHRHSKAVTACLADGLGPDEGKKLQKAAKSFKDDVDFCSGMLDTMRISLAAHRLAGHHAYLARRPPPCSRQFLTTAACPNNKHTH